MKRSVVCLVVVIGVALAGVVGAGSAALRYRAQAAALADESARQALEIEGLKERLRARPAAKPALPDWVADVPEAPPPPPDAESTGGQEAALTQRIAELERELAQRDERVRAWQPGPPPTNAPPRGPWGSDPRQRERRFREADPERYKEMVAEMVARREEMRESARKVFEDKAAFFAQRDVESLDEQEAAKRQELVRILDESRLLMERSRAELPEEERHAVRGQLRANFETLGPLLESEREREFRRIGIDLGCTRQEADEFVQYVNQVLEATSVRSLWEGMRPGRSGGRGPGAGAPAAPAAASGGGR